MNNSTKHIKPFFPPSRHAILVAGAFLAVAVAILFISLRPGASSKSKKELDLGEICYVKHDYSNAIKHYDRALALNKNSVEALNNTAWLLATAPDARFRNGNRAMALATRACELTHYKQPFMIGTLAAACAEAGHFNEAVANAKKASTLATAQGRPDMAKRNEQLLKLYQAHQAYHENPAPAR